MRALSIRQPYVEQVFSGTKNREYRSRRTHYRGPLVIHASRTLADPRRKDLPVGAFIGMAWLTDTLDMADGFAWLLREPRRFRAPIPGLGRLGIFSIAPEVASSFPAWCRAEFDRAERAKA